MMKHYQGVRQNNILYSCATKTYKAEEQFVEQHVLLFVRSGKMRLTFRKESYEISEGSLVVVGRNQLAKGVKIPPEGAEFESVSIYFTQELLRFYAEQQELGTGPKFRALEGMVRVPDDAFLHAFFGSLEPYITRPGRLTPQLAALKTFEALELILSVTPGLDEILFNFSPPHKIDLEKFMAQNFMFNAPVEAFARLTGRSKAEFKRDFERQFKASPAAWLKQKRLEEAFRLMKNEHAKPSEVYLTVGFENLSHFSVSFKQAFGINPSALK